MVVFNFEFFSFSLQSLHIDGNQISTVDTNLLQNVSVDNNYIECQEMRINMFMLYMDNITLITQNLASDRMDLDTITEYRF